jgi:Cft2 family RNA processing exonuclease
MRPSEIQRQKHPGNFTKIFPFLINFQFDCGIHPAYDGVNALPYFDLIDPKEIDLLLVTQ